MRPCTRFVYTPLKQLSQYNTDIGAVVGAVPPVMGYVAAAGGLTAATGMTALLSPESALVGALLFAWQVRACVCIRPCNTL
jgi:protoheme IX farnesyltransferase